MRAAIQAASEILVGVAEIATQTETNTGTDDTRIVTPLKIATRLAAVIVDASTTVKGILELATTTEAIAGTDADSAVTPSTLRAALDNSGMSTNFNAIGNNRNTAGKYAGRPGWNTTLNRPIWATGSTAASVWVFADGTTAHTPA